MTTETRARYSIETEACTRCGGGGMFGPLIVYQGKCFKCSGSGKQYTRAGAKVRALYDEACKSAVSEISVGTRIVELGVTMKGDVYYFTTTVETIESDANGYTITYRDSLEKVGARRGFQLDGQVTLALDGQEKQARLAALAPRAGLLLDGQPTKAPSKSRKSDEEKLATKLARSEKRRAARDAVPASEKQIALIAKLLRERGSEGDLTKVTKRDASVIIDRLLAS